MANFGIIIVKNFVKVTLISSGFSVKFNPVKHSTISSRMFDGNVHLSWRRVEHVEVIALANVFSFKLADGSSIEVIIEWIVQVSCLTTSVVTSANLELGEVLCFVRFIEEQN